MEEKQKQKQREEKQWRAGKEREQREGRTREKRDCERSENYRASERVGYGTERSRTILKVGASIRLRLKKIVHK